MPVYNKKGAVKNKLNFDFFGNKKKLTISITKGTGEGRTELSAFDAALNDAGIANYNLITLSSIVPPNSEIKVKKLNLNGKEFGHRLYIVLAKGIQVTIGMEIWSGIGWVRAKDGRGLFVEHIADNKHDVIQLINNSLEDMKKYRKDIFGRTQYVLSGIKCKREPVCSVVAAVYQSQDWNIG